MMTFAFITIGSDTVVSVTHLLHLRVAGETIFYRVLGEWENPVKLEGENAARAEFERLQGLLVQRKS